MKWGIELKLFKNVYFRFSLVILWMVIIYMFSMENANESSSTSGELIKIMSQIIHYDLTQIEEIGFIIRKAAHMFSYFTLGLLSYWASLLVSKKPFIWASIITVGYACLDEIHQLFVPGRSGQFTDVLIDSSGMLIGFILIYLYSRIKK